MFFCLFCIVDLHAQHPHRYVWTICILSDLAIFAWSWRNVSSLDLSIWANQTIFETSFPIWPLMDPAPAVAMEAAAAPAGEPVDAPAVRAPRRVVPEAFWEYMVLDDASNKSNLSEDDIAGLMLCVAEWTPCGATSSNNLCGLLKGNQAVAWFHFSFHSRLKVKYMGTFGNSFALFQAINQNHPPIVARQVATMVFNIQMEKFQEPDDDHPYPIQFVLCKVFNLAGVEMASVHLPPNTLCVRFKEIVCRHLTMTTQQKDCCRFVCQNGKMMPGNNATLRSWCPEIWVFNPRKAPVSLKRKRDEAIGGA